MEKQIETLPDIADIMRHSIFSLGITEILIEWLMKEANFLSQVCIIFHEICLVACLTVENQRHGFFFHVFAFSPFIFLKSKGFLNRDHSNELCQGLRLLEALLFENTQLQEIIFTHLDILLALRSPSIFPQLARTVKQVTFKLNQKEYYAKISRKESLYHKFL